MSTNPLNEVPPHAKVMQIATGSILSQALFAAANMGIADHLTSGPQTAATIAREIGAHPGAVYRLLRTLASVEIFSESGDRQFGLTPMAECLLSEAPGSLRHTILMMGSQWRLRAWEKIEHSIQTGRPAFDAVFGMPPFEYFRQNPEPAKVFNNAMVSYTSSVAPAIAAAYDFKNYASIVDVAGGHGYLLAAILKANLHLQGTLFDLPEVVEGASPLLKKEGVLERASIVAGSFFDSVVQGADLYLLKQIIHDWDDADAVRILTNCRLAMRRNSQLLLIEASIAPGNAPSHAKLLDLEVLVALGGKERTEAEYENLLHQAGLRLIANIDTSIGLQILKAERADRGELL